MPLLTPVGVLSYPKVFKSELGKDAKPTDFPKWSTTFLMTTEALKSAEFKAMVEAALSAAEERFGKKAKIGREIKWDQKQYSFVSWGDDDAIRMPFRRDTRKKGYPDEFVMLINVSKTDNPNKNVYAPSVVDARGRPIADKSEIYPGVRARLSLSCFAYEASGNRGVSFGLNNVQKAGDAPRIDGSKSASEEFGALPEEAGADDLAALLG